MPESPKGKVARWAKIGEVRDLDDPSQYDLLNHMFSEVFRALQIHEERLAELETAPERQEGLR